MVADPLPPDDDQDRRTEALQRYHALQVELAEHQLRHPETALRVELVATEAYVRRAVALIDDLIEERDEAHLRAEQAERALDQTWAALSAAQREIKALRWCAAARERTFVRLQTEIRDLRRRLPRFLQGQLTPAEAFNATHPIEDVIGRVVPLERRQNGHRHYLAGVCPFHEPNHVSLAVYPWHGQFMCYVCGSGGTAADFARLLREKRTA